MRYFIIPAFLLGLASANASAGVFTDDLSRCTIQKTSDADKTDLMRWMFASATRDPALASMTTLTQAQRDEINKTMAGIYNRLILVDCRAEAIAAIKNEGFQAFGESGRALGAAAANKLMSSPAGQEELSKWVEFMDKKGWEALGTEAGVKIENK